MVKRIALLVVCLLALSLTALADSMTLSHTEGKTAENASYLTVPSAMQSDRSLKHWGSGPGKQ